MDTVRRDFAPVAGVTETSPSTFALTPQSLKEPVTQAGAEHIATTLRAIEAGVTAGRDLLASLGPLTAVSTNSWLSPLRAATVVRSTFHQY